MIRYPGTSKNGYGETGNVVIFGHSSYFKNDNGRYKTVFQQIIELDKNESILIYQKQDDGSYKLFEYTISASYNTKPTDVKVLLPKEGKELTLFTCTPVGGIAGRWIVKATLKEEPKSNKKLEDLKRQISFNLSESQKATIEKLVQAQAQNQEKLQKLYFGAQEKMATLKSTDNMYEQLRYLKMRVLEILFETK